MSSAIQAQATSVQRDLRRVFSAYPTGVVALCAKDADGPNGMAMNSFATVSLDPPLVSVCVSNTSATWEKLKSAPTLGISVLSSGHGELCRKLSARGVDRFAGVDWREGEDGAVLIADSALWLECAIWQVVDGGDHQIVLLEVKRSEMFPEATPLLFHQSQFRDFAN